MPATPGSQLKNHYIEEIEGATPGFQDQSSQAIRYERRHSCEKHDGSVQGFTMNVMGMFQSDAMLRQISESTTTTTTTIQINKVQQDQLINTKTEWSYFWIPRAVITQS